MLILLQIYWLIAILGILDFDFLDIDFDLEGSDGSGILNALAVFINLGGVPFAFILSIITLNFWIIVMLMYYLPIKAGGLVTGILLLPALILSVIITKYEIRPFKDKFVGKKKVNSIANNVLNQKCILKCDLEYGRLGQAEVEQEGASIVINVKVLYEDESFTKDEDAFVLKKDEEKDYYYISKLL